MENEGTNLLEIIRLAYKLVAILIETTKTTSEKLAGLEEDNVIKTLTNVLKVQAAAMESELVALRQELVKAQDKAKTKRSEPESQVKKVQVEKESQISDMQKARCQTDESKVAEDVVKAQVTAMESEHTPDCSTSKKVEAEQADTIAQLSLDDSTVQIEMQAEPPRRHEKQIPPISAEQEAATSVQAGMGVEQEQPQPLTAEALMSGFADIWQQELKAAAFPNATDKIVFAKALSDMANQDATLRMDAVKALAGIRHELSAEVLADQVQHEQSAQVRQECIKALAALEMKEGLTAVENALSDQAAAVRLTAVWGLYHLAGAESAGGLIRMLSDEDSEIRRRAVTCIGWLAPEQTGVGTVGNIGSRQVVSALVRCLKDPEKSVRTAVLGALEAITGKKMGEQLPTDEDLHQDIIAIWEKWWKQQLLA